MAFTTHFKQLTIALSIAALSSLAPLSVSQAETLEQTPSNPQVRIALSDPEGSALHAYYTAGTLKAELNRYWPYHDGPLAMSTLLPS